MFPVFVQKSAQARLLSVIAGLAAFALAFTSWSPASARGVWCAGDPAIVVNGSVVDVNVNIPLERLADVRYVDVVFHVPSNANVTATINDSLLFRANVYVVKDLPTAGGLLGTPVRADVTVVHSGEAFDFGATTVAAGSGTRLWVDGNTASTLSLTAKGLLNVRLF